MNRALASLVSLNLLIAGPVAAQTAAQAECSSPSDQAGFDVGALKSELSILAIACSNQEDYNRFVERFRGELVSEDHVVNAWFNKSYGRAAQAHYDQYITLLANEQSSEGQRQGSDFCPRLHVLFNETMAVPDDKLLPQYAAAKSLIPAAMGTCALESGTRPTRVAATRPTRSTAHKK